MSFTESKELMIIHFSTNSFFRRLLYAWNFLGIGDAAMNDTDKIQPRGAHIPEWADQVNKTHNMLDTNKCYGEKLSREGLGNVQGIMVVILNCWGEGVKKRITEVVTFE